MKIYSYYELKLELKFGVANFSLRPAKNHIQNWISEEAFHLQGRLNSIFLATNMAFIFTYSHHFWL